MMEIQILPAGVQRQSGVLTVSFTTITVKFSRIRVTIRLRQERQKATIVCAKELSSVLDLVNKSI